tara:strand:+ start:2080 stop:2694 length:615 start_codon:yes stop_codon:yes gene_type:complete
MTLQSSGAISINDLVGEYGGSAPHSLSEYYKGGGLVGNHSNNPNVPTSGTISLNNFYGANNTAPVTTDNIVAITLTGSYTVPGAKFGNVHYGVSPPHIGSFTDSSFTNFAGTATYTMTALYQDVGSILANSFVRVTGNFNGVTWASAFGYSNMNFSSGGTTYITLGGAIAVNGIYNSGTNTTVWNALGANSQFPTSGSLTISLT